MFIAAQQVRQLDRIDAGGVADIAQSVEPRLPRPAQ
jgi:hypothetical protein